MKQPKLAIVIIGRNEGDRLASCLQSVAAISAEAELIYVDSASTDGSAQLAANFGAEAIVLHGGTQTAARARNAGWQRARAPLILFLDGDTILNQHFPAAAIKVLRFGAIAGSSTRNIRYITASWTWIGSTLLVRLITVAETC
jgi:glycosyltransferase involved in cell wall biosynthesis